MNGDNELDEFLKVLESTGMKYYIEREGKLVSITVETIDGIHCYNYTDNKFINSIQMNGYNYIDSLNDSIKVHLLTNCTDLYIHSGI